MGYDLNDDTGSKATTLKHGIDLSAEIGSAYDTMDLHTSYYLNHMTVNPLVQYYLIPSISATYNTQAFAS